MKRRPKYSDTERVVALAELCRQLALRPDHTPHRLTISCWGQYDQTKTPPEPIVGRETLSADLTMSGTNAPHFNNGAVYYSTSDPTPTKADEELGRLEHALSESARYHLDPLEALRALLDDVCERVGTGAK